MTTELAFLVLSAAFFAGFLVGRETYRKRSWENRNGKY